MSKLNFKKLDIEDKEKLEEITHKYLPFSDFTFLSLFTYNTKGNVEYCFCNANLVIKFEDYIDGESFYSLIGDNKLKETIHTLLKYAKKEGLKYSLNLVPQTILDNDPSLHEVFKIVEDPDNFDYIISSVDVAELSHDKFHRKRKLIDDFKAKYPDLTVKPIELRDEKNHKDIIRLCNRWRKTNKKSKAETETEITAIKRLLSNAHHFPNLYALGIYKKNKLVAFNTFEVSTHSHGISSFQKADKKYDGIYAFLTHEMAKNMVELGCNYINFEQDLGIEGLRSSKNSWHPVNFLKKYKITYPE